MDESQIVTDELQRLQSSITSLFKSVLSEKNKCKLEKEKSVISNESLLNEIANLRKENELLRKFNSGLKNECETCIQLRETLFVQNKRSTKLEKCLHALRKLVIDVPDKIKSPHFPELLISLLNELGSEGNQEKHLAAEELKFFSGRSTSEGNSKCLAEVHATGKTAQDSSKKISGEKSNEQMSSKDIGFIKGKNVNFLEIISSHGEIKDTLKLTGAELCTPKKQANCDTDFIDSPLCNIEKGELSPIVLNRQQTQASLNQFKRKADFLVSESPGKSAKKNLFLQSPKRNTHKSPGKAFRSKLTSQPKFTNAVEVEVSLRGVRKLKQAQLNVDYYKSKNKEQNNVDAENTGQKELDEKGARNESKFGEDDLILESPKRMENYFHEFRNFRLQEGENEGPSMCVPAAQVFDPDETFVSSFYVRQSMKDATEKPIIKTETPSKSSPSGSNFRSPEYESVPSIYKGSPVRKKSERMKLPGQMCMECNKYYKEVLGEISPGKLQEILDRCSRHRDRHYNVIETPPGYWKPYLTATMDTNLDDNDTCSD